jgi:hypothetical protein
MGPSRRLDIMGSEKAGIFSSAAAAVRKRFFDNFNRADQSGLGTATDGSRWRQIRGSFNISGNKAVGADNNYPMAVADMPFSNVDIAITGATQGSAAALWVTDSGNWWAVGIDQTSVTTCQTCSDVTANSGSNCSGSFNTANWNCITPGSNSSCTVPGNTFGGNGQNSFAYFFGGNAQNSFKTWNAATCTGGFNSSFTFCAAFGPGNCRAWRSTPPKNCTATNAPICNSTGFVPSNCKSFSPGNENINSWNPIQFGNFNSWNAISTNPCQAWTTTWFCQTPGPQNSVFCNAAWNADVPVAWNTFSCNCVTTYPQYIRIMKSVGSVVSEVFSTTIGAVAQSFRVKTNGNQITVKAYSDPSLVTQIGSDIVHTPTGVTVTSTYGITIDPSSYNQGYSVDGVEITKN